MLTKNHVKQVKRNQLIELREICVSEGISVSLDVLGEEWDSFEKLC